MSIRASCAKYPITCLRTIWNRIEERFGSAELVESALRKKLQKFPKFTDMKRLYEVHDILTEIDAVKGQTKYRDIFAYLDSSIGVKTIIQKLPHNLQEKWVTRAVKYKAK